MMNKNTLKNYQSSAEKINYLVRPAKQVERKLIIETLHSLNKVYNIKGYEYVGMGSLFYVDYKMFHKYLGIKLMISFEKEEDKIERFNFNRPYDFIKLKPGISTDILPTLDWKKDLIIWLDYDMPISLEIVNDIQIISNYIKKGGILIITLDAEVERFDVESYSEESNQIQERLNIIKKILYPYYPSDVTKKDVTVKTYPLLLQNVIKNAIIEKTLTRDIDFYQIFNFIYKDSTKMYTFGCIFEEDSQKVEDSGIYDLGFVSKDLNIVDIDIPILTPLEKLHLDKLIPDIKNKLTEFKMDKKKLKDYEQYYKYYPQYFESYL